VAEEKKEKKVLIVDNDPDYLDRLSDLFRGAGYQVTIMRRGKQVVDHVKKDKPTVIVMDVALPDKDGVQVIKELKDDWDAKKVPVVVVSDYTSRINASIREKIEGVLPKPFSSDELLYEVQKAVKKAESSS
jgi:DNA-binding response OmpR family regulator